MSKAISRSENGLSITLRVTAALAGGYGVTALAISLLARTLVRCGMVGAEAVVTAAMLGFIAYLVILLWALACPSLLRLWFVLTLAASVLAYFLCIPL